MAFLDMKKGYGSVRRNKVWEVRWTKRIVNSIIESVKGRCAKRMRAL